jgi:hypothetical protein
VLQVARENQLSRFGTVKLDGTKIHANASPHGALSYGHAEAIEAQLKGEVQALLALADAANLPDGMSLAEELKRREDRLAAIAEAKVKIEARVALTRRDNSVDEQGFRIQRKVVGTATWVRIVTVVADTRRVVDTGLTANTAYRYRVQVVNAAGVQPISLP